MHAQPEFVAAARLVAFANLKIIQDNWGSLWKHGGYRESLAPLWTLPGAGKLKRRAAFVAEARARMAEPPGELWRAFVDDALRIATGRDRGPYGLAPLGMRLTGEWIRRGAGGALDYQEFRALHRLTRRRLQRICADDDLPGIVRLLRRLPLCLALEMTPGEWRREQTRFCVSPAEHTLAAEVGGLFVQTAVAGLWPRFFKCAAPGCERFGVARLTPRERNFCSTACRVRANRGAAPSALRPAGRERRRATKRRRARPNRR